jgi:hypothetical protein
MNINNLVESEKKNQLDNLLCMCNLTGIVDFPLRINHTSATCIDSIFIDMSRLEDSISNDLSDRVIQILTIKISFQIQSFRLKIVMKVEKYTICDFIYKLNNKSWDSICHISGVNFMFNP